MDDSVPSTIVVIGGGSFQGKSLLSIALAAKYRISLVVSTDTIRNILHSQNPECPHLATSTYLMSRADLAAQFDEVSDMAMKLVNIWRRRGEHVILEGMHLSEAFVKSMASDPHALLLCLDNRCTLRDRLKHKAITRNRIEYQDSTGAVEYVPLTPTSIDKSRYTANESRIAEIHRAICDTFLRHGGHLLTFIAMSTAMAEADARVSAFLYRRDAREHQEGAPPP